MRIEQTHSFLNNLLKDVAAGRFAPAPMQRPYVWERSDVEAFCNSVLSGYPIGSVMIWDVGRSCEYSGRLGPVIPETAPSGLILDGHNRLATAAWMMSPGHVPDPSEAEARVWMGGDRLVLDVSGMQVRFVPEDEMNDIVWVPASTLLTSHPRAIRDHMMEMIAAKRPEREIDMMLEAHNLANIAFMEAKLAVVTVSQASPDQARDAFLSVCRTGVPISPEDFEKAAAWVTDRSFPSPDA